MVGIHSLIEEYVSQINFLVKSINSYTRALSISLVIFFIILTFGLIENYLLRAYEPIPIAETIIVWLDIILKRSFIAIITLGIIIQLESCHKLNIPELVKRSLLIFLVISN